MEAFNDFLIPRQFVAHRKTPCAHRPHIFGDASPVAYAAVAYLGHRYDGTSAFALIMSRSRLAPLAAQMLPRLESLAARIAVRLKKFLAERIELEFERVRFYTDSMITYHWATSESPG